MKTVRIILWALVAIFGAGSAWLYLSDKNSPTPQQVSDVKIGGPFELIRADKSPITQDDILGRPHAIFFGFTNCPEICPTTLFEASSWLKALGTDGDKIDFYFFTVDPERDTAEVLAPYVGSFDNRITGVTGTPEKMAKVFKDYKVYVQRVDLEDDDYTMDHSASVLLFRENGNFLGTISYGENTDTAIAKLRRLLKNG